LEQPGRHGLRIQHLVQADQHRGGRRAERDEAVDRADRCQATTVQSFTAVEGADLMAKLEAAQSRARERQAPYWSAYTFDVRPGVAVDAAVREFNGNIQTMGDTSVFVGTTAGGVTVETRNLAIFLLREPSSNQITRMEVYNLERKREYSGYPVYWLGRANNEESLNYLRAIAAAAPLDMLSERAVLSIALHDDARVGGMLKNFVSSSPNPRIRSTSVYWLGQVGGESAFLASLVRNDAEELKLRRSAAYALGQSRERGNIATLQQLYQTVKEVEVRRSVISAAGNSIDEQAAFVFLLGVTKNDADWATLLKKVETLSEASKVMLMPTHRRDRDKWMKDAQLMVDASAAAVDAAKKKDLDGKSLLASGWWRILNQPESVRHLFPQRNVAHDYPATAAVDRDSYQV